MTADSGDTGVVDVKKRAGFVAQAAALVLCCIAAVTVLGGCAGGHRYEAGATAPTQLVSAGGFGWEGQALEASGTAKAPEALREPQRSIAARRAAKTQSIANLKEQISALPVVDGQTLGSMMENNLGLRHAVESHLQKAQVLSENKGQDDTFVSRVRLPLEPVSDILRQYNITPEAAPELPPDENTVAPVS